MGTQLPPDDSGQGSFCHSVNRQQSDRQIVMSKGNALDGSGIPDTKVSVADTFGMEMDLPSSALPFDITICLSDCCLLTE